MNFETLFIIVIILSMLFYYVMTYNCRKERIEHFAQIKNMQIKNNTKRHNNKNVNLEGFQNQPLNNNLINDNNAVLMFFYSKTCPHCIDFIPTWEKLKKMKVPSIKFENIEGDSDDNDAFIKYNIKYLPTLILQFEEKTDFDVYKGDRSIDDIIKFVRLNGINLNTTILEGFVGNDNDDDDDGYVCDVYEDFEFEKGIFKLEEDIDGGNKRYTLEMKNLVKEEIPTNNKDLDEAINPVYYLVSKFINTLRTRDGLSDDEIAYELNKCNIKMFLKNVEYGLCYNSSIKLLKKQYKNDKAELANIELIEKKVCDNDNYIIKQSYIPEL
jgi:thiol-disulfide isomerase/thioredoxin